MDTIRFGLANAQVYALLLLTIGWELLNRMAIESRLPKLVQYKIVHESAVMAVGIALVETSFIVERGEDTFTREHGAHALLNLACGYPCANRVKHLLMLQSVQRDILSTGSKTCRHWLDKRGAALNRDEIAVATQAFVGLMRNERIENSEVAGLYFMAVFELLSDSSQMPFGRRLRRERNKLEKSHFTDSSASI